MEPHPHEIGNHEIIDAHSHIGNILYEGGGRIIEETGLKPKNRVFDTGWILERLQWEFGDKLEETNRLFRALATYSGRKRIAGATLENMRRALKNAGVYRTCCLPIPPNVTFEDLKSAQEIDNHIIPFTGVDFNHMDGFAAKLRQDVSEGAKGMKIHPILQNVSPDDERMHQVVEEFGQYDLPILFHTGKTTYYFGEERKRENPDFGKMELMEKLVAASRGKTNIILGHAGIFEFEYTVQRMAKYPNAFVDTTFQSPKRIQKLINAFGSERVVFGSDWPYADIEPSIKCVEQAVEKEPDRRVRTRIFRDNIKNLIHLG